MNPRFIFINLLVLAGIISLAQFSFTTFTQAQWPHWAVHLLFAWLFVASLGGYALVESKMKAKPKDFINTFMLVSGLRMMVSVLIIVFLVLYFPAVGKYISIYYVVGYLLFLVTEVVFLFNRSKKAT